MSDVPDDELVPGLPGVVVERIRSELGARAEKLLGCLRTATALVAQAEADVSGLRLAESAVYNLREALNHVVEGQGAAEGGLGAVLDAWRRFQAQAAVLGVDAAAARDELDEALIRVEADESWASYYARRLMTYLQDRAGVSPVDPSGDPVSEYGALRQGQRRGARRTGPLTCAIARLECRPDLGGEELGLFPGGEVAAFIGLVEVGEGGVALFDLRVAA